MASPVPAVVVEGRYELREAMSPWNRALAHWPTTQINSHHQQKNAAALKILCLLFATLLVVACGDDDIVPPGECSNGLTAAEEAAGWRLLFDGVSLDQWRSYQEDRVNSGWGIENGCITRLGMGGDLITREQFSDFELKLEWRISDAGNSGIFIRGDESGRTLHYTGYEMQVLDNAGHFDAREASHRAGALYDMIAPDHDTSQPVGHWNRVHIIAAGPHVEFWLNDRVTAQFKQGSPEWQAMYERSKFTGRPHYGSLIRGHIGLQDHWDKVWFRNIRLLSRDSKQRQ
ncbi:MAG: DUF1080 domain-containing protein [Halioglobus sp.]|nr:DUF1080 domain-containing protein [Halioglobus sp.]